MTVNGTLHRVRDELSFPLNFLQHAPPARGNDTRALLLNATSAGQQDDLDVNTDLYSRVTVTVLYALLFALGLFGNSTALFIFFRRRAVKHLQGAVHYHLASLAVSDLFVLVLCLPVELYNFIWIHHPWAFGEVACKSYYLLRDGCSYASSLSVASLSVERYVALCHPLRARSVLSPGRTRRVILALWATSLVLAAPMLVTMGETHVGEERICTTIVSSSAAKLVLQVNALLSFVVPMLVISTMNGLIGRQLHQISQETLLPSCSYPTARGITMESGRMRSLRHGVQVLRVLVIAFVVCWLPYHTRRLMYCYVTEWTSALYDFYHYFYMVTNVLFYMSSAINPILYNLVSSSYRQIFFSTLGYFCWSSRKLKAKANSRSLQFPPYQTPTTLATPRTSQHTLSSTDVMETMN
ncbi:neurotensin receptor type 1-like [Salminus brasiliensis]|uniref:neurotensin receptor type 1-like n=1 Tax=Salminus brasiliensis TaxID=930266 RepID=UPI003B8364CC